MINAIYLVLLFSIFGNNSQKLYQKDYFANGYLKSEGWMIKKQKVDYWFFYYDNKSIKEEGHYFNNQKCKWWTFYNSKEEVIKKCEFLNDKMDGLCIVYEKGTIIRAEKYKLGKKVNQWNTLADFKKDNALSRLE